jgi:hypothetical protein
MAVANNLFGIEVQIPIDVLAGQHEAALIPLGDVMVVFEISNGVHLGIYRSAASPL